MSTNYPKNNQEEWESYVDCDNSYVVQDTLIQLYYSLIYPFIAYV